MPFRHFLILHSPLHCFPLLLFTAVYPLIFSGRSQIQSACFVLLSAERFFAVRYILLSAQQPSGQKVLFTFQASFRRCSTEQICTRCQCIREGFSLCLHLSYFLSKLSSHLQTLSPHSPHQSSLLSRWR